MIVGVGLIGGSFSLALSQKKGTVFRGYDTDALRMKEALQLGIVDGAFEDYDEAIKWADIIVLAVPVNAIKERILPTLDRLKEGQMVVDFGSTKGSLCMLADSHPKRSQYLAAHPIAGTEHSGPSAAFGTLFKDKNLILCDTEKTDPNLLTSFESLARSAGFYLTKMDSDAHDRHLAYISHLSHVSSYVLSNTVLKKEQDGEVILDLAGSGFESTVRLAKSSPAMWGAIFLENKEMILKGIAAYKEELNTLEQLISNNEASEIADYLEEGRKIRKILK